MRNAHNQTIALAGIFQAAALVKQIAWQGSCDENSAAASINSLFAIDSDSIMDIYGSMENLQLGLKTLIDMFATNQVTRADSSQEIVRYTLSLIHLERRLIKNEKLLGILSQGIKRAKTQTEHFSIMHDNVLANLAGIYTDTLSTFNFRIHVTGNPNYLTNPHNTNKVRSFLLAGIRSTVLWRQMGGSRWQFIFSKKKYLEIARKLLASN